jgi:hypothetical protein
MEVSPFSLRKLLLIFLSILSDIQLSSQETVILRTDREIYACTESVWIYINCLENGVSLPSQLSRVVYVDLINRNGSPVVQLKCIMDKGEARVSFKLPDSLSTGNYLLRGYTKWMRNFDESFYGRKVLSVINPFKTASWPQRERMFLSDTVFIYPEGGNFLADTENKVLIRSLDTFGKGVGLTGYIVSSEKDTLMSVTTNKKGFAVFNIQPAGMLNYSFVYHSGEKIREISLPIVKPNGSNLKLVPYKENSLGLKVFSPKITALDSLILTISTPDGVLVGHYFINPTVEFEIPQEFSDRGILLALLFDKKGNILSSRPFKAKPKPVQKLVSIGIDKPKYGTRQLVDLCINRTDSATELRYISISVVKKCLNDNSFNSPEIINNLVYSANIIEPGIDSMVSYNDLLILHRNYTKIWNQSGTNFLPEMKGEMVSGIIKNTYSNQPIANIPIVLSFVDHSAFIDVVNTDSAGRFHFVVNQYGEKEMVIQPLRPDSNNRDYKIFIDQSFAEGQAISDIPDFSLDIESAKEINNALINMQIRKIYSQISEPSQAAEDFPELLPFYGKPEYSVQIDKFIELGTTEEIIKELLPFTSVIRQKGMVLFKVSESKSLYPGEGETLTFVDGVPVFDVSRILEIPAAEIKKADIINLNYFFNGFNLGRLLLFHTIKGNLSDMEFDHKVYRRAMNFFSPNYRFLNPRYSEKSYLESRVPDFRNVLFFQTIESLKNCKNCFTFYTSDELSEYSIIVKGIRPDGIIETVESGFIVED